MIKLRNGFWTAYINGTKYNHYLHESKDIEVFLQDTIHHSACVYFLGFYYEITFSDPKFETLFRLKYPEHIL